MVFQKFGVCDNGQRLWIWEWRQNLTYRPSCSLTDEEETQMVNFLYFVVSFMKSYKLCLLQHCISYNALQLCMLFDFI